MLDRGLTVILENGKEVIISITYLSEHLPPDVFIVTANLLFPELNDSSKRYKTSIIRSIPLNVEDYDMDATRSFELLVKAFDSDYIKYVISSHIEDYYKSAIVSWIDTIL